MSLRSSKIEAMEGSRTMRMKPLQEVDESRQYKIKRQGLRNGKTHSIQLVVPSKMAQFTTRIHLQRMKE